ncbi:MAG TPA: inositol monophosphatase family protein [Pilimelia sp.]|nr:inositol monophosphatase family protein [Pilimelia sp.]
MTGRDEPRALDRRVDQLLRATARTAVLPLFERLRRGDPDALAGVAEKALGEVVTAADREAERLLDAGLRALLPGSEVVGEEAVADDPTVLDRLAAAGPVWLVDPVDGTANFAAGREPFMMMVALRRAGVTEAAWILDPRADRLAHARRGAGAYLDGVRVRAAAGAAPPTTGALRGAVLGRTLPEPLRAQLRQRASAFGALLPGWRCAGREYPDVVTGRQDFALFWRTLPWDHVPGALFAEEAGGMVRRLDGAAYDPTDRRAGLLCAASPAVWYAVRDALFGGAPDPETWADLT